jgi:hypothetical protein
MEPPPPEANDLRRLLHRWFVQYNPFYLISATLCIVGLRMISLGLAERGNLFSDLAVGAITEVYAVALIGGAALLTRLGQRRPAVMLALLAALYQGDVIFHVEASSYLHAAGVAAATVWALLFVAKLYGLAWAMKIRPSHAAMRLAAYGGLGLAFVPQTVNRASGSTGAAVVALWLFSLGTFAINVSPGIASKVDLDDWGQTVRRRATAGVWALWALMLAVHVYFWRTTFPVPLDALVPAAALLATRAVRRESQVWIAVTATLAVVAMIAPPLFAITALMAAVTLTVRAFRHPHRVSDANEPAVAPPFRTGVDRSVAASPPPAAWILSPASPAVQRRLLVGALFASYLAAWTFDWSLGPWPVHRALLDIALTIVVVFSAAKARTRFALVPLATTYAHWLVQVHVVTAPRSTLQWGLLATGSAYAMLMASLGANYFLRERAPTGSVRKPDAPNLLRPPAAT